MRQTEPKQKIHQQMIRKRTVPGTISKHILDFASIPSQMKQKQQVRILQSTLSLRRKQKKLESIWIVMVLNYLLLQMENNESSINLELLDSNQERFRVQIQSVYEPDHLIRNFIIRIESPSEQDQYNQATKENRFPFTIQKSYLFQGKFAKNKTNYSFLNLILCLLQKYQVNYEGMQESIMNLFFNRTKQDDRFLKDFFQHNFNPTILKNTTTTPNENLMIQMLNQMYPAFGDRQNNQTIAFWQIGNRFIRQEMDDDFYQY